jgi:site-specific DNA-methyltransferase (adenine-specific)
MILRGNANALPLADESISAVVTDPPYGLGSCTPAATRACLAAWLAGEDYHPTGGGFMGKEWDSWVPAPRTFAECYRVLKPGGHLVAFASSRTLDLMALSLRLAGFEIRDTINWLYWSGFPKSLDVSKAIDAAAGAEREVVGPHPTNQCPGGEWCKCDERGERSQSGATKHAPRTAPATDAAKQWEGWGTALKPAFEPAILARKPLSGTVAATVLEHGTGGLHIDACRYAYGDAAWPGPQGEVGARTSAGWSDAYVCGKLTAPIALADPGARWPANIYACPKASRAEREAGCEGLPAMAGHDATDRAEGSDGLNSPRAGAGRTASEVRNSHPTVKPIALMRWLVRLVTPPGGVVLDPFCGSGTTLCAAACEGVEAVGIEIDPDYVRIAQAREAHWLKYGDAAVVESKAKAASEALGQGELF